MVIKEFIKRIIPDKLYLQLMYKRTFKKKLDLKNPKGYNEKLQWLKLYDRKPIYTKMVDKYEVKKYVSKIIGEEYIIPTLGVWDKFDDIDFSKLPDKFVLKCTHDSAGIVICKDKTKFDYDMAKLKIEKCLKENYFFRSREWPYKNVVPRIIVEPYLEDSKSHALNDYKFFCFDGKCKLMYIATERQSETQDTNFDFYSDSFEHLNIRNGHPNTKNILEKPDSFDRMKCLAEKLSQKLLHVRVDFYEVDGKNYFGELTFYHMGGLCGFEPEEWDYTLGSWIDLSKVKK